MSRTSAIALLAKMEIRDRDRPRTLGDFHAREYTEYSRRYGADSPEVLRLMAAHALEVLAQTATIR